MKFAVGAIVAFFAAMGLAATVGICASRARASEPSSSPWTAIGDGTFVGYFEFGPGRGTLRCVKVVTDARMVGPVAALSCD